MLGLSTNNTKYDYIHDTNYAYLFSSGGKCIWHNNTVIKSSYGENLSKCNIKMFVNSGEGSVSYMINDQDYGMAFKDVMF